VTATPKNAEENGDFQDDEALELARIDPELQRLIDAWPDLPAAIRRAMLALIG
jgi:hypothetical protein